MPLLLFSEIFCNTQLKVVIDLKIIGSETIIVKIKELIDIKISTAGQL
jgi:hypothetical protein